MKMVRIPDEKMDLVRNQCGRHNHTSMSLMLNVPISSLRLRMKKEGIPFKPEIRNSECDLCKMKSIGKLTKDQLQNYLRFNMETGLLECSICGFSKEGACPRSALFKHIRSIHRSEISMKDVENAQPCDGTVCRKLYGRGKGKRFWCEKCLQALIDNKPVKEKTISVCPECGISVVDLRGHLKNKHLQDTRICEVCSKECPNIRYLKEHMGVVHNKVPCTECGKLFGVKVMKRHMLTAHTPSDQMKHRCDTCGKGFYLYQRLADHMNKHTGEKPYKCKFCSLSFASINGHAKHEKGHIAQGHEIDK